MTRAGSALVFSVVAAAALSAQAPAPALVIQQPEVRAVISGPSELAAEVLPTSTGVLRVTFFVDGQPVCQATGRPFTCRADVGQRVEARTVRVVADLEGGGRLVSTRRTRPRGMLLGASTDAVLGPVRVINGRGQCVHGLDARRFVV